MCKRMVCAVMMCLAVSSVVLAVGGDMGGSDPNGSPEAPYLIEDVNDFDVFVSNEIYHALGVHTMLTGDLDLSDRVYTDEPLIWYYSGVLDGDGHTIYGLTIDNPGAMGLFSLMGGEWSMSTPMLAVVRNLSFDAYVINSQNYQVGVLAGWVKNNAVIENCHVTNSHITSSQGQVGGLIGMLGLREPEMSVTVSGCSVTDTEVSGMFVVGGLIGDVSSADIQHCYTRCTVQADNNIVGGLAGYLYPARIENCYADSEVTGLESVGGLVGLNDSGKVINCYAAGKTTGISPVGGLCGYVYMYGDYEDTGNFWDTQMTQCATSAMGSPATTAGMMTLATFTGWDFTHDWMMLREGEDYPRLRWQRVVSGDIAGLYGVNMADLAYLSRFWLLDGCTGADDCGRADIDGSGDVGMTDLEAIINDWLMR